MILSGLLNKKEVFFRRGMGREIILPNTKTFEKKDYKWFNVLNKYKDYNGYVQKILFITIKNNAPHIEGEYYNDRNRTMVPVLEGDILLMSKYGTDSKEYKLVQIDYSFDGEIRTLFDDQDKSNIAKYLVYNNLVYIKQQENKKSQIDSPYVKFITDRINHEQTINQNYREYTLEQLQEVLKKNIVYKEKKYALEELLANRESFQNENHELDNILLIARRSLNYADEIFKGLGKNKLTLNEIKTYVYVCEYNYIYNL